MKNKLLFIFLLFLGTAVFVGCNDDDNDLNDGPCSVAWAVSVQDEASALANASQAYGQNATVQNCNNYKAAAQAYLDALEPYNNCTELTGTNKQDWQAAINAARESINNLNCQ